MLRPSREIVHTDEVPKQKVTTEGNKAREVLLSWQTLLVALIAAVSGIVIAVIQADSNSSAPKAQAPAATVTVTSTVEITVTYSRIVRVTGTTVYQSKSGDLFLRVQGTHMGLPADHIIYAVAEPVESSTPGAKAAQEQWLAAMANEKGDTWTADLRVPKGMSEPLIVKAAWYSTGTGGCPEGVECSIAPPPPPEEMKTNLEQSGPSAADGFSNNELRATPSIRSSAK